MFIKVTSCIAISVLKEKDSVHSQSVCYNFFPFKTYNPFKLLRILFVFSDIKG